MTSSYNGWEASRDPRVIGINPAWEPIKGHKFPGGTKSGDVQTVFTYLVQNLDARVEAIEEYPPGDEWGYNYRPNVNNPSTLSCHASGTAIDYNATQHPNDVDFTWSQAQAREIHKILDELGGVVRWLEGHDEMHFEIRGTAAQVAVVAKKLRGTSTPTPPTTTPPKEAFLAGLTDAEQHEILERVRNAPQLVVVRRKGSTGMHTVGLMCGNTLLPLKTQVAADQFKYALGQPNSQTLPEEMYDSLHVLS